MYIDPSNLCAHYYVSRSAELCQRLLSFNLYNRETCRYIEENHKNPYPAIIAII